MKNIVLLLLMSISILCPLAAQTSWTADNGNGTFTNPLFYDEFSDPDIIRVGEDFYMAGTTMHCMPGLVVLHSKDLVNWKFLSYAFNQLNMGDEFRLSNGKEAYGQGIWAPCIRYHKGKFYIFSNINGHGMQVFISDNPAGPWEHKNMGGNIYDLSVLFDDNDKIYAVYKYDEVKMIEIKPDFSGYVEGSERVIIPAGNAMGEGHHIYKIKGKYYIISADYSPMGRMQCARADKIEGPYETAAISVKETMGTERVHWTDNISLGSSVPEMGFKFKISKPSKDNMGCATLHQGGIVDLPNGDWWGVSMLDFRAVGRTTCLSPVTWRDGWPYSGLINLYYFKKYLMMNRNTLIFLLLLISNVSSGQDLKLWYSQPARNWSEALPIGNSRLGAMVYGGTEREELQLNEETFWAGGPYSNNNSNAKYVLPVVRNLIFDGKNGEAQSLVDANFLTKQHGMSYLTLGNLYIDFPGHKDASGFYRDLNLENATTTTRYEVNGVTYTRTTFASFTDNVIIVHIQADKTQALNFNVTYNCPLEYNVNAQDDKLIITCQGKEQEGIKAAIQAECVVQVKTNGAISPAGKVLQVEKATEATLYIAAATNYVNYQDVSANASERANKFLKKAIQTPYNKALKDHIAFYKKQFDRVRLNLPSSEASKAETPRRIENFNKGEDMAMAALLFQFGRYLLISSSQPGGQPANLQGIWNNSTHVLIAL